MIAKNPSSKTGSTASDAPLHTSDDNTADSSSSSSSSAGSGGGGHEGRQQPSQIRATAEDFKGNPGPVVLDDVQAKDIEKPASKQELRARMEELNKD